MVWLRQFLVLKLQNLGKLIAQGELKTQSHVSDVIVMQIIIIAISLNPVLCLMQWDGRTTHLTTSRNLYSLILALFKWMAACRTYRSHYFTEKQKIPEQLSGSSLCNCLQHTSSKSSAYSWNMRAAAFTGRACWQYVAITLDYGL